MLNKLFSSKTRVEILKLFLFNTNNSFYQRQISNLTAQSIRGVQREVDKLNRIGLIERSIQGNRIYYKVNKECPIVEDLKNIFFKSVGIAEVLKDNFKEKGIKVAFIYGSYARGEESLLSDIDLMVLGDISLKELSSILSKPKKELMREINYAVFSLNEFINKAMRKDHFINSVLKDKKIYIIGSEDELKRLIKSR
ncbi:MAG: nucleotidyltransferase domain-containing protein [Actinobacteria bacterium]|nr:nucleotidyltransferase domain-containing protein [Actinomycetota bacterium]MBE3114183.1 nucleotidyltransferase domain-containing protein [Actinomycetota bacterium]